MERARSAEGAYDCYPFGEYHHLVVDDSFDIERFSTLLSYIEGLEIKRIEPTIEDMFIKLMKR